MDLVEASAYHRHTLARLNRSPQTLKLYAIYQNSFLAYLLSNDIELTLNALTPELVRRWQAWLRSQSTGRRGGIVSEKQGVQTLKIWSHFLSDNDVYPFDPLARLKIPRVPRIHRKPFTEDEAHRLVQAASAGANPVRDRALLLMLLDTGCRIGELCAATVADVDLEVGAILFNRTKNGQPRAVKFRVQGRRDGGPALVAIRTWLKVREAREGVESLFTTRERWPLSTRRAREIFTELGQVARVPDCHPHRCRHAQPLHAPVLTPTGWRPIGTLSVGDEVIGSDGRPTVVIGVYPQGPQEVVRARFSDGALADCTLDHLWAVRPSLSQCWPRHGQHFRVLSTRELMKSRGPWHTPVVQPIEFAGQDDLPVDPYTLGALLGDGHIGRNVELASAVDESEVIARIEASLPAGMLVGGGPGKYRLVASHQSGFKTRQAPCAVATGQRRPDLDTDEITRLYLSGQSTHEIATTLKTTYSTVRVRLQLNGIQLRKPVETRANSLRAGLTALGLTGSKAFNKAIPPTYLTASIDARRELLRGLMDTDGYAYTNSQAMFTTISSELASGVVELVRSLGGIATVRLRRPYATAKHDAYRIHIRTPFTPFHMTRKCERFEAVGRKVPLIRTFVRIDPVGVAECVCIEVANPDGLYVTQDYVVTHNTAASEFLAERPGAEIQLRSRLGQVSPTVLADYVTISDPSAAAAADVASLSQKWGLGAGQSNGVVPQAQATRRGQHSVPRFCPSCGHPRGADDRFCAGCGRSLT